MTLSAVIAERASPDKKLATVRRSGEARKRERSRQEAGFLRLPHQNSPQAVGDESPLAASGDADDFDTVLAHVGVGKWNYIYYIANAYWHVVLPYHTLAGAFLSPSVNHTCHHLSPDLPPTIVLLNNTAAHNALRNITYLSDIDNSCSYLKEDVATGRLEEVPCTEWVFDNATFTSTVTSERACQTPRAPHCPARPCLPEISAREGNGEDMGLYSRMLVKSRPVEIFHRRTSTGLIYKNCPDWWIFDRRTNTSEPKAASKYDGMSGERDEGGMCKLSGIS
ncbi:hypothetical protein GWK47_033981 [Chionoecetes opilio]|uniref:Uncharacterized protein n=1 Tax=Chionoecetes opilio TaxID=41210 RepID=A0A8J5D042_CHIOP|nr:hypothetical protein GWK47_033981 [Chionoecetes opilio]